MILIDTSIYIEASEKDEIRELLEAIAKKYFVLSCGPIEKEIDDACDFLRKIGKRQDSEKLRLIYTDTKQGVINPSERIKSLASAYGTEASHLSKDHLKEMKEDLLIVASASVASASNILSLNRKTMASEKMVEVYKKVNIHNKHKTPVFITKMEDLVRFLKLP